MPRSDPDQQLVALGVGLHQPVLDAVVDHLGEVPGAGRAGVGEPALGRHGRDRTAAGPRPRARRRRRPSGSSPRCGPTPRRWCRRRRSRCLAPPARRPGAHRVTPAGVAAVHHDIAGPEQAGQLGDHSLGGLAGGHHHPHHPGGVEPVHQLGQQADLRRRAEGVASGTSWPASASQVAMLPPIGPARPCRPSRRHLHQLGQLHPAGPAAALEQGEQGSPSAWACLRVENP